MKIPNLEKIKISDNTILLRLAVATVFLTHSLHGIFTNGDVNNFGNLFLNKIGFNPFGVLIAWMVVIIQVISSIALLVNKFIKVVIIVNIPILVAGIVTVHFKEGWFVVGAGRNGMEFSFVLILILISIIMQSKTK